jgi:hypothetical protein
MNVQINVLMQQLNEGSIIQLKMQLKPKLIIHAMQIIPPYHEYVQSKQQRENKLESKHERIMRLSLQGEQVMRFLEDDDDDDG